LKSNGFLRAKLSDDSSEPKNYNKPTEEVHPLDANLISSKKANGRHTLMLDLDIRHYFVASSTSGHSHLYVDTDLEPAALKEIIDVLAKHGVVQEGIKNQLDQSGFLTLRPPGVKKGDPYDDGAKININFESLPTEFNVKEFSHKFEELANKLKNGGSVTSGEFGEFHSAFVKESIPQPIAFNSKPYTPDGVYKVMATGAVAVQSFKQLLNGLGLDNVLAYSATMKSLTNTNVTYLGKPFCISEYHPMADTFLFTFYEKDFHFGQHGHLSWNKLMATLKTCFGG
jgi:hypothetical protein